MRCPQCKAPNEANAAICKSCGLILLKPAEQPGLLSIKAEAEAPKRRAEDYAGQRRRANDSNVNCQFCSGEISAKAIRCRHCSEIVNEDYYRERSQRLRARINYSSWVAYLFGLGALLVFRPVGILSIAAGLIMSIIYYAIPVEPPASAKSKSNGKKSSFGAFLKRQLRMERVQIPIPAMRNKRIVLVGTPLVAALIGYSANLFLLQEPVNQVLKENSAFSGMKVSAHYEYWVVPGVVEYDLQEVSLKQTPIDVHTALLEFAKKVRDRRYSRIDLSYKGTTKFSVDGDTFRRVGSEYAKKNYDYVLYSFPRLFHAKNGAKQPNAHSDRDALMQFHKQWYGDDAVTHAIANGMM